MAKATSDRTVRHRRCFTALTVIPPALLELAEDGSVREAAVGTEKVVLELATHGCWLYMSLWLEAYSSL